MIEVPVPETRFADTAVGRIAYQIAGDGPPLLVAHPVFPIDLMWDEPRLVHFLEGLSSFSRSTWFDPRGRGASDPLPHDEDRFAEASADDMLALIDRLGFEQVSLLSLAVPSTILFAAAHPERVQALVLFNTSARLRVADDYPEGTTVESFKQGVRARREDWGSGGLVEAMTPSAAGDERFRRWVARAERLSSTADEFYWRAKASYEVDLRPVLPSIQVPTLVLYRSTQTIGDQARYVADHILGARSVELPGEDYLFFVGDTSPLLDAIEEFLTGRLPVHDTARVLATVVFTDLVGSTEHAAQLGDRRWKELLDTHDAIVVSEVERFRGRVVKSTGDGALATFDGPGRAIRCACAIRRAVRSLGIEMRAGLHAGEIEIRGDDVAGLAIHIAARVSATADPGDVVVSSTVRDLVAGSGIELDDRGVHELKGVPEPWKLFAVRA